MKRSTKILLLALTVLPVASILLLFVLTSMNIGPDEVGSAFATALSTWGKIAAYYTLGLTAFYLVHASKREYLKEQMLAWAVLLLFFGILTQPVYWYMHVWSEPAALQ